jgi:hypothetical protein
LNQTIAFRMGGDRLRFGRSHPGPMRKPAFKMAMSRAGISAHFAVFRAMARFRKEVSAQVQWEAGHVPVIVSNGRHEVRR